MKGGDSPGIKQDNDHRGTQMKGEGIHGHGFITERYHL